MEEMRYYGVVEANSFWVYSKKFLDQNINGMHFSSIYPEGMPTVHKEEQLDLPRITEEEATLIVLSWGNNK